MSETSSTPDGPPADSATNSVDEVPRSADGHADEADDADEGSGLHDPGRPSRIAAWLLIVGSLALAGLFVAIPAHTYDLELTGRVTSEVRRVDFVELWRIQARNLPDVKYDALLQVVFILSGLVVLVGAAGLIWLATVEVVPPSTDRRSGEGRAGRCPAFVVNQLAAGGVESNRHRATSVGAGMTAFWALAMGLLVAWVARRLGAFSVWATVIDADGVPHRVPVTFATVDHPFHAARADLLRRVLLDGDLLRWIANHQGGYPVEFYPLGVAWLDVAVWAAALGALPLAYVHKLVVIAIFVLPGLAYWLFARRDGLGPAVAFVALVGHVAVPGGWWHGGFTETVQWGLITNVAAAVALLFVLWGMVRFVNDGQRSAGGIAVLFAAFAISTNPRSLVGLGVVGLGVLLACVNWRESDVPAPSEVLGRLGLLGVLTAGLAAPELMSLVRFSDLYYFVRYEFYEGLGDYLSNSIGAVSPPVALLGLVGVVLGFALPRRPVARAAAYSLILYMGFTALLSVGPRDRGFFEQLEATRLMPFQRLLAFYLAAVALQAIFKAVVPRWPAVADALAAGGAVLLLVAYVWPIGPIRAEREGLFPVMTTATTEQADFLTAISVADTAAPPGQAMLVLGTTRGWEYQWHQQLWAPFETDRPLFYDNWLWYWHTRHAGPYDYRTGHAYPTGRVLETLGREYLDRHGIAAVVITGDRLKEAANRLPYLSRIRGGVFDVFLVQDPAPIVNFAGGTTASVRLENGRIVASGTSTGGTAEIARNWYPRWRAWVNGNEVDVTRGEDGYMSAPVPAGEVTVELVYVVDRWDWLARLMVVAALAGMVWLVRPWLWIARR